MLKKLIVCSCLLLALPAFAQSAAQSTSGPSNEPASAETSATPNLRSLLAAPSLTVAGVKLSRDELDRFYADRDYQPCWDYGGPQHAALFERFMTSFTRIIAEQGLRADSYPLAVLREQAASDDPASHLNLELLISDSFLRLAHELHGDDHRLDHLYTGWNFHREPLDIPTLLANAVAADDLNDFIDGLPPNRPAYRQLLKALAIYRDIEGKGGWPVVDAGPALHPGETGQRVAQLRARLTVEAYLKEGKGPAGYDAAMRQAVSAYQLANGLEPDGNAGKGTLAALNVPVAARIDQITANLERWRHIPDDFPPGRYILVNIPAATVEITEARSVVYRGPVIVGRVDRATPFIDSIIKSVLINPVWHVPTSIARKDILPKLRKDPHYLEKQGITVDGDASGGKDIDWKTVSPDDFNLKLRQESGDMNSLGRVKFDFENSFSVYMHGTPHQNLFGKTQRSLSSGCVRLRDPTEVAKIVMAGTEGDWTADKIEAAIATNKTQRVQLAQPIPIYIFYWTVFADDAGKLNFRPDIYGYDQALAPAADKDSMPIVAPPPEQ